jgi:hypothetical protein
MNQYNRLFCNVNKLSGLKKVLSIIFCFCGISLCAQIGGRYAFESLSLPSNARLTALGGHLITVLDEDVALAQMNPALINSRMNNQLSINHNFNFAGISNGNLAFGKSFDSLKVNTFIAVQYIDYGSFQSADAVGNVAGEFSAGELAAVVGASKQLNDRIRGGVNFKILTANYESYGSWGLGFDIGLHYQNPESNSSWAIVLKNMGAELNAIVDQKRSLPFELQMGYSKKLKHLPFRFSIIGQQLQKWYIRFDDPDQDFQVNFIGEVSEKSGLSKNIDNLFRHLILNGEFLIGKAEQFRLRFGYNHLRKQELKLTSFRSLAGFSVGFGFNIKKIKFDYGIGYYHLSGATNHLSIGLNMDRIFNKI